MNLVEKVQPHLPFLRRYARALTGSQDSGDAYIRASLMALAEDPSRMDLDGDARVSLYKFFHAIWQTTGARLDDHGRTVTHDGHETRLHALAPVQRQAFLLTALEGFSRTEAAEILHVSRDELGNLIAQAQKDIEDALSTDVLIIEDEPIIAADLEALVEELGHKVTGIATTRSEAVQLARANPPGLVLCDIQLADDSSGIDAARDILSGQNVPVIFITAFPERLLTGNKPEPTYLVPKPFQENTVKAVIGQALFFHPGKSKAAV